MSNGVVHIHIMVELLEKETQERERDGDKEVEIKGKRLRESQRGREKRNTVFKQVQFSEEGPQSRIYDRAFIYLLASW